MLGAVRTKQTGWVQLAPVEVTCRTLERMLFGTDLDVSVQSAGTLGAVWNPVGLLVDGSQARWGGGGVLSVALHLGEQDAAQGGLGGRVQHQLRGKGWKHTSAT